MCCQAYFWFYTSCVCGTGGWTQGFVLFRQVLYHLCMHDCSPFVSGYLGDRVSYFFFPQSGLDHDPSILCFHSRWDGRHVPPHPALFHWDRTSQTFGPGWPGTMILWISASRVAKNTSVSYKHPLPTRDSLPLATWIVVPLLSELLYKY
jgi:hypothetical protein